MMASEADSSKNGVEAENEMICCEPEVSANFWSALDDHLQEKIIARLPFRCLFQLAPSLSKTWRLRFGSPSFQKEIETSATVSWKSYGPLLVNYNVENGSIALAGYESNSQRWHRLPTHYLPHECRWDMRAGNGSLFCWIGCHRQHWRWSSTPAPIIVTNPLTRSWRELPPRPKHVLENRIVHLVLEESKAYKVILGSRDLEMARVCFHIQIFDSTDGAWSMESYYAQGTAEENAVESSVVRNGILYILVRSDDRWSRNVIELKYKLIVMDVKEKTFKEVPLLLQVLGQDELTIFSSRSLLTMFCQHSLTDHLLVCGSKLMVVIFHSGQATWDSKPNVVGAISVFRLDVEHGLAIEVSRAPNGKLTWQFTEAACHGDCIYIGAWDASRRSIYYNVESKEWNWFNSGSAIRLFAGNIKNDWNWRSITYQPGSEPFLKV